MKKVFYILFFFSSINLFSRDFDFQTTNQEQGYPSSGVTGLFQDSGEIIWISTSGGGYLKYDEFLLKSYDQSNGLDGNIIGSIVENKNIVISTLFNGIHVYNGNFFRNKYSKKAKVKRILLH